MKNILMTATLIAFIALNALADDPTRDVDTSTPTTPASQPDSAAAPTTPTVPTTTPTPDKN
jgi:hypothetical protein